VRMSRSGALRLPVSRRLQVISDGVGHVRCLGAVGHSALVAPSISR
jgi:hypothetical protein